MTPFSRELLEGSKEPVVDRLAPGDSEFPTEAKPEESGRDQSKYRNRSFY